MSQTVEMHIIARIRSDFPTKFGIPRQSGLADVPARIVFEPEYRNADALRGIEGFSHLWLIWQFSAAVRDGWSPTIAPARWAATSASACLRHARRSGRTRSDCPRCGLTAWSLTRRTARCCTSRAQI